MSALGLSRIVIDPSNYEANVEEVVGDIAVPLKKWSIEEDQLLISGSINCGTHPTVTVREKLSLKFL